MRSSRRGIGAELKASYFRQAALNVAAALHPATTEQSSLLDDFADIDCVEAA